VTDRLLILGWHNVESTWLFPSRPGAGSRGLERQLRFLRRFANVVDLRQALAALAGGRPLPPRAVAITFDDGYRDQLELAAPMLERLGLPATFFLVPGVLSRAVRPWWEMIAWAFTRATREVLAWEGSTMTLRTPAERHSALLGVAEQLKRRPGVAREAALEELTGALGPEGHPGDDQMFLDWDGARRLARGRLTIASHTFHHGILSQEDEQAQQHDLLLSKQQLEQELDLPVDLLAYPNGRLGDYDRTTMAAASRAGYTHAITTLPGWNRPSTPPYEVLRFVQQPERGVPGLAIVPLHPVRSRLPVGSWPGLRPSHTSGGT
jgi:peptidoglycan/xylan/chitin deacetylase (PgdA/CDA1 family)